MHNNYYFLRKLSEELKSKLQGFTLVSCFSQNKDELVIEFNNEKESFFIKASLQPDFQCLSFPAQFHRARKNSIDLFNELLMKKVTGVRQFRNERSFGIDLNSDDLLVFKMHAARSNVIWFRNGKVREIFRNNFTADEQVTADNLDRDIDWSFETFKSHLESPGNLYFTFGKPVWSYLKAKGYDALDQRQQWELIQKTLVLLENPGYSLVEKNSVLSLSLLPEQKLLESYPDPFTAINDFFIKYVSRHEFLKEKQDLLSHLTGKIRQSGSFLQKTKEKLSEIENDAHYQQWADLIMANMNNISPGMESIQLENFYDHQNLITVKLKPGLSPQKNAEVYYRKARNQSIEIKTLRESIAKKEKEVMKLTEVKDQAESSSGISELRSVASSVAKNHIPKKNQVASPYHEFEFKGFRIWVGKNAQANDELTLKHSYKEDLWLHAKDVAGSHVLIKHQSGKVFPKDIIERAAQLAAYYSKRKNESLCPVVVTPKKFVRKRKGDPAGTVVVEREEVILVEPAK